jgi:multiple sugar transport system substrate-binding protein
MINYSGLIASTLLILTFLSGCTSGGAGSKPTSETRAVSGEKASGKPAELVFYSTSADTPESFDQRYGNAIRKKFPNYTIKYIQFAKGNSFDELLTRGEKIDIYWDSISTFSSNVVDYGLQYDMTELVKRSKMDLSRFEDVPLEAVKRFSNGGMYGIPVTNGNMVIYYNKDLFDKFGIAFPKDGMTWDEFNQLAKKLNRTQDGVTYTGLSISAKHLLRMNNFSEPFANASTKKQTIGTDNWKKVFSAYFTDPGTDTLMKEKSVQLKRAPYYDEFFKLKTSAMFPFVSNQPATIPDLFRAMNWDVVSFPTFKELPGVGSQAYPVYFGITAQSKEKEAAMEVISYLTSDEYQMDISKKGIMSVLNNKSIKDAYGTETEFRNHNLKSVYYNKFAPIQTKTRYDEAIVTIINNEVPKLVTGDTDMNTFIRTVGESLQRQIDTMASK